MTDCISSNDQVVLGTFITGFLSSQGNDNGGGGSFGDTMGHQRRGFYQHLHDKTVVSCFIPIIIITQRLQ